MKKYFIEKLTESNRLVKATEKQIIDTVTNDLNVKVLISSADLSVESKHA